MGLRARLWLGCLAGVVLAGALLAWILWFQPTAAAVDSRWLDLALVLGPALVLSAILAIWLDRGIVRRLRSLIAGLATGQTSQAQPEPGWGELGDLSEWVQTSVQRQRQLARAIDDLERIQRQIAVTRDSVEHWVSTERWQPPVPFEGPLRAVVERLNQGFARETEVLEQNTQAALQVKSGLIAALAEAKESAEQAEHGFVEATALLTSLRELQRLSAELQNVAAVPAGAPAPNAADPLERWRSSAAAAIEELITAANESVEHLGAALLRVHDIAEQVNLLANRATLIALNSLISGATPERAPIPVESAAGEMKQLARDVRTATDRVGALSREIESEVQSATDRMRGIRERVAVRLEQAPALQATEPSKSNEDALHLLERVREMVQDATRKCERLSVAGERTSRAADALVQKLDDEARDMEGLAVRLAPAGSPATTKGRAGESAVRPANLRVLGTESNPTEDTGDWRREERP